MEAYEECESCGQEVTDILEKDKFTSMICGVITGFMKDNGQITKVNKQHLAKRIAGDLNGYLRQVSVEELKEQAVLDEVKRLEKENKKLKQQSATHSGQIKYFLELLEDNGIDVEDL